MTLGQIRTRLNARRQELLKMNVLVLAGGASREREISLVSGGALVDALTTAGYSTELAVISEQGIALEKIETSKRLPGSSGNITSDSPGHGISLLESRDVVFTMMHGSMGEDGTWQGLLKLTGKPFVSADVKSCAVCMDKDLTKHIVRSMGLATARWWTGADLEELRAQVPAGLPKLVVKPVGEGSSFGVAIIENDDEGWNQAAVITGGCDRLMAEEFVDGTEVAAGCMGLLPGPEILPLVEISPNEGFYDFESKYTKGASQYFCPARIDEVAADAIRRDAGLIAAKLSLEPFCRMDFILGRDGRHMFLEANTLPGFTELSLLPMAAATAGVCYRELLEMLLLLAVERHEREGVKG